MSLSEHLKGVLPDLTAEIYLYPREQGGKERAISLGYGCPLVISKMPPWEGWDAKLLLGEHAMLPGERRILGLVFLTPEGLETIRRAGRFFLWEGRVIGEGVVLDQTVAQPHRQ